MSSRGDGHSPPRDSIPRKLALRRAIARTLFTSGALKLLERSLSLFGKREPWTILTPGLGIFVTVVVFHLLGDALRDVLDPKEVQK